MFGYDSNLMAWWLWGGGKKNNSNFNKYQTNRTFIDILNHIMNLAVNTFEWEGLPETADEKYIEKSLLFNGNIAMGKDKDLGLITLPFNASNNVNIYGDPTTITLNGLGGYNKEFIPYMRGSNDEELHVNAVRGYDNPNGYPAISRILDAAARLTEVKRTMDITVKKLKNPYLFIGDKSQTDSLKKMLRSVENNEEAILVGDRIDVSSFRAEDIHIDTQVIEELWNQYMRLYNEVLDSLGINTNPNFDKNSGVSADEVQSNNQSVTSNLDIRLRSRERFCEDVNALFDLNMSVKIRHQEMVEDYGLDDNETETEDNNEKDGEE